jgi:hypothetical protein
MRIKLFVTPYPNLPIWKVLKYVPDSILNSVPERRLEIQNDYPDITIELIDVEEWILDVNIKRNHIRYSRGVAELLWATAYSYGELYTRYANGVIPAGQVVDISAAVTARQLLEFAVAKFTEVSQKVPPLAGVPPPGSYAPFEEFATEISLMASGFLLHHELAHIILKHPLGVVDIDLERDADIEAARILLSDKTIPSDQFNKRIIGAVIGIQLLVMRSIYTRQFSGQSHPRTFDRLFNTLEQHVTDPNHLAWALSHFIVKLHLDNAGIPIPIVEHNTHRDCLNYYIDQLAAREAKEKEEKKKNK